MPRTQRHTRIIPPGNKSFRRAFWYIIFPRLFFLSTLRAGASPRYLNSSITGNFLLSPPQLVISTSCAQGMWLSVKAKECMCVYETKYSRVFFLWWQRTEKAHWLIKIWEPLERTTLSLSHMRWLPCLIVRWWLLWFWLKFIMLLMTGPPWNLLWRN